MIISKEGDFELVASRKMYKILQIQNGYVRNTKTGENCGQKVTLYKSYYKDGVLQDEPIYDEDCYEFVFTGGPKCKSL